MERDKEAAGRYRKRAENVRTIANEAGDKGVRRILNGVADDYDQMARDQDKETHTDAKRQERKR